MIGIALLQHDFVPLFEMHPSATRHPAIISEASLMHIKARSSGSGYVSPITAPPCCDELVWRRNLKGCASHPADVEVYHAKLMTKNQAAAFPYRCVSRSRRARFRADAVFTSVLAGRHYSDERARRRERDARLRRPTIINRAPSLSRDVVQFHRPASASDRD
jgi:hypothetical protein